MKGKSKDIESQNLKDRQKERQIKKLLLLGAGESGKSTFFKQITSIYGRGYDDDERATFRSVVHQNVISGIQVLIRETRQMKSRNDIDGCEMSPDLADRATIVEDAVATSGLTAELAKSIQLIWDDPGLQKTYENRAKFQLIDNVGYFFQHLARVSAADYSPTDDDVVNTRVRTTGIVEMAFEVNGESFKVMDVGGQKNERRKWVHCFDDVTAVLFVAAVSEYDQVLFEDETTNRVEEALTIFDEISNSVWFKGSTTILFLNKRDLFKKKLPNVPLKNHFPDFDGEDDYEAACEFMKNLFIEKNRTGNKVYTHMTCATDKEAVSVIFSAVLDVIVRKGLAAGGFV